METLFNLYDQDEIIRGEWRKVLITLQEKYPELGFKKTSHDSRIYIWAENIPDGDSMQFNESNDSKRCWLETFVRVDDSHIGVRNICLRYDDVFDVIEKYLEERRK